MLVNPILEVLVPVAAVVAVSSAWWLSRRRASAAAQCALTQAIEPVVATPKVVAQIVPEVAPLVVREVATRIVVGKSVDQTAFEIALLTDEDAFNRAAPVPSNGRMGLASQLGASLQAAPSLLVQHAHQGRHLMEVVINNPLANGASGSHFLPFAKGADGKIIEQAKLLNPDGLSSLVKTAALWQVASVVVAQKHLADISAKLDEIKLEIVDLKDMFQDLRDGYIEGTYRYLSEVAERFRRGEVSGFARVELESCRRELLQTESALIKMFERRVTQQIEHTETFGTRELLRETLRRYDELDKITASLMTCFKTEALAWHVLSLFSAEEATAQVWKDEIVASIDVFSHLRGKISETASADGDRFRSWVNPRAKLHERRTGVQQRASGAVGKIELSVTQCRFGMSQTSMALAHNNDPIRLGVEVVNGEIQRVRVLA